MGVGFKVQPVNQITVTVEIKTPRDYGKVESEDMDVTFCKHPVSKLKADVEQIREKARKMLKLQAESASVVVSQENIEIPDDDDGPYNDARLLDDIIDIQGLRDEDGNAVQYNRQIGEQLLEMDYVRQALNEAWIRLNMGEEAIKVLQGKN